jgi:hypothetical protein
MTGLKLLCYEIITRKGTSSISPAYVLTDRERSQSRHATLYSQATYSLQLTAYGAWEDR